MIMIIDNYDSFTYNLYQYIGAINPDVRVIRNDKIDIQGIRSLDPSHIIISPGPGFPQKAGISTKVVQELGEEIPILGVCLGHQAIGHAYGAKIVHSPQLVHGKASDTHIATGCPIFHYMPPIIKVGRYHSLIIERESLPEELVITAETPEGLIMGVAHKDYPVFGVQFHPESLLTQDGLKVIENFLLFKMGVIS